MKSEMETNLMLLKRNILALITDHKCRNVAQTIMDCKVALVMVQQLRDGIEEQKQN